MGGIFFGWHNLSLRRTAAHSQFLLQRAAAHGKIFHGVLNEILLLTHDGHENMGEKSNSCCWICKCVIPGINHISSGGRNDERESTLNALLVEMDGFNTSSGVVVLAGVSLPIIMTEVRTFGQNSVICLQL